VSVYKVGKNYVWDFWFDGNRHKGSTHQGDREAAKTLEAAERTKLALGKAGIVERKQAPSLKEFSRRFTDYVRTHRKPVTANFYVEKLTRVLKFTALSESPLDQIDEERIGLYIAFRRRIVGPATVNRELATLRLLLGLAQEWRVIDRIPRIHKLPGERQREFVLKREQEKLYLEFAPQPLRDVALLMVDTGMGPGEVQSLEWKNVHLTPAPGAQRGYIRVRDSKTPYRTRNLLLTERVRDMLTSRKEKAGERTLVFTAPTGDGPISRYTLRDQHNKLKKILKLSDDFVPYSLRHTFGTRLGESREDAFTIKRIMGHATVTTSQRYVHPTPELVEQAFERLEALNNARQGGGVPPKVPPSQRDAFDADVQAV
jgi:integrase